MKPEKKLRLGPESVIDKSGKIIEGRPEDFPELVEACQLASATIKTGLDYRVDKSS